MGRLADRETHTHSHTRRKIRAKPKTQNQFTEFAHSPPRKERILPCLPSSLGLCTTPTPPSSARPSARQKGPPPRRSFLRQKSLVEAASTVAAATSTDHVQPRQEEPLLAQFGALCLSPVDRPQDHGRTSYRGREFAPLPVR